MFKYSRPAQASFAALVSALFSFVFSIEPVKAQSTQLITNSYENYREPKKTETEKTSDFNIKFGASLGYEQVNQQGGFGINGNLNTNIYDFTISAEVVDFYFYGKGSNSAYYTDTFSNGQSRCRNASNGQFAKTSNCSPNIGIDVNFLRNADLSYKLPIDSTGNKIFFGAGIPISDPNVNGVYSVFGYESSSGGIIKTKLGNNILDIRIGF